MAWWVSFRCGMLFGRGWRNWQTRPDPTNVFWAAVAELGYAMDLGSIAERLVGSNPTRGTENICRIEDPPVYF